jgi:hypothetical protein
LLRCNPIETFDTALVRMEADLPDAPPVVLALAVSHATAALVDPELEYRYSRGRLVVQDGVLRGEREGAGELAKDYGPITGPDPVADKLDAMLDTVRTGRRPPATFGRPMPKRLSWPRSMSGRGWKESRKLPRSKPGATRPTS